MEQSVTVADKNSFVRFLEEPIKGRYAPPMTHVGDYLAATGSVLFIVSVFFLKWITVGAKDVFDLGERFGWKIPEQQYGLFVSPWAWVMVGVLVVLVLGIYFVQTRGGVTLAVGIFCLIFNVVFYIGAWQKINAIIGDIVQLVRAVPIVGNLLGEAVNTLAKSLLSVHVSVGYWLFIPAGALLVAGGALRLAAKPRVLPEGAKR